MALPAALAAIAAAAKAAHAFSKTPAGKALGGAAMSVYGLIQGKKNPGDKTAAGAQKKGAKKLGEAAGQALAERLNRRRTP